MTLRRFLPVYGGKRSIAKLYTPPKYDTIIEPFAGGAGYSLEYPDRQVILYDLDVRVCAVWDMLIHASEKDILSIPVDIEHVDDLPDRYGQDVKWFVGWWMQPAAASGPAKRISSWGAQHSGRSDVWSEKCRARIAGQVHAIKHWRITHGSYERATPTPATWFVDPPYEKMGVHYKKGSSDIDFTALGEWCKSLPGQVIVCENEGADWLPFQPLCDMVGGQRKRSVEVVWESNDAPE